METEKTVNLLRSLPDAPANGLPEEVFLAVSRMTPMVNVDLLIDNEAGHTLLTWRQDAFHGPGWHVPGGIVHYGEKLGDRVAPWRPANCVPASPLGASRWRSTRSSTRRRRPAATSFRSSTVRTFARPAGREPPLRWRIAAAGAMGLARRLPAEPHRGPRNVSHLYRTREVRFAVRPTSTITLGEITTVSDQPAKLSAARPTSGTR